MYSTGMSAHEIIAQVTGNVTTVTLYRTDVGGYTVETHNRRRDTRSVQRFSPTGAGMALGIYNDNAYVYAKAEPLTSMPRMTGHAPAPEHTQRPVIRDGKYTGFMCVMSGEEWVHDISCECSESEMAR